MAQYGNEFEPLTKKEIVKGSVKATLGVLAVAAGSYLVLANNYVDILGDRPGQRTADEAAEIAQETYNQTFDSLSPADKFTLQYGGKTTMRIDYAPGGNGILGMIEPDNDYRVEYNNGCLANTAYDINGGSFTLSVSGLFFHVESKGEVPTAAAYAEKDQENPDVVHIISGNSNSINLNFSGVSSHELKPMDEETNRILETYGCQVGMSGPELMNAYYFDARSIYNSL